MTYFKVQYPDYNKHPLYMKFANTPTDLVLNKSFAESVEEIKRKILNKPLHPVSLYNQNIIPEACLSFVKNGYQVFNLDVSKLDLSGIQKDINSLRTRQEKLQTVNKFGDRVIINNQYLEPMSEIIKTTPKLHELLSCLLPNYKCRNTIVHRTTPKTTACINGGNNLYLYDTKFLHRDTNFNSLGSILYLSENTKKINGATAVVPTSHLDGAQNLEARIIERVQRGMFWERDESNIKKFMSLSKKHQKKNIMGTDIIPELDKEYYEELVSRIKYVEGGRGTFILFDPACLHVGGNTIEGERVVLETIFGCGDDSLFV
jgi:hypothetical protein